LLCCVTYDIIIIIIITITNPSSQGGAGLGVLAARGALPGAGTCAGRDQRRPARRLRGHQSGDETVCEMFKILVDRVGVDDLNA